MKMSLLTLLYPEYDVPNFNMVHPPLQILDPNWGMKKECNVPACHVMLGIRNNKSHRAERTHQFCAQMGTAHMCADGIMRRPGSLRAPLNLAVIY